MQTGTLFWLFTFFFMLHDLEEVIMMRPWLARNRQRLVQRFPAPVGRMVAAFGDLSTSAFAFVAGEEYLILAVITYLAVEYQQINMWAGLSCAVFLHYLVHIGQSIGFGGYVPVVATSLLASVYSAYVLFHLASLNLLQWGTVFPWMVFWLAVVVVNLLVMHRLAARFDRWLAAFSAGE